MTYTKVKYDPHANTEAEQYLNDLLKKCTEQSVRKECTQKLNIYFDEKLKVVFIDFDLRQEKSKLQQKKKDYIL